MKIVLVGPVYPYKGGIAHYTSLLHNALIKEHDITLISYKMQYPKLLFKSEQKDYSNEVFKIENTQFLINTANPFNIIGVAKRINEINPDAVIIQWWHPYFAPCYRILTNHLKKNIKILFTCHNVFPHERFPMDRFLTKLVLNKGDGFIVHSKSDENDLLSFKENANRVFNPIPTYNVFKIRNINKIEGREEIVQKDRFDISDSTKLLLFFGFIREYKGLKHLINAMPQVAEHFPDCRLLVVGSFRDDKEEYVNLIKSLGVDSYIYIKDTYTPDNEVEKYFSASDLVVLPYEDATQSAIVQVAFGFEKPVLVTNVGGLPDVVEDTVTGYVINPFDSSEIAQKIIDFFENNREEEFVENIKNESSRFSWNQMVKSINCLVSNKEI